MWFKKNEVADAVELVNNHAEGAEVAVNSALNQPTNQRQAGNTSGGYDNADTLHQIYCDFGYPNELDFSNYWNMYRRLGVASAIVEIPVDASWITPPTIESSDNFKRNLDVLINDLKLWQRLKGLDTRQRVSRYAGLFMVLRDGKKPEEPVDGGLTGVGGLVRMIPLYESQLRVVTTDSDTASPSYGMPTMYEFNGSVDGNRNEDTQTTFNIHPDRIVIAAEGADDGSIYGKSVLEAPYNSLMDLRKIVGAGGEGFYKNAAQSVVFELTDATSAKANKTMLDKFNDVLNGFMRSRFLRSLWTPGLKPHVLESNLAQPKQFFDDALADVAAASKIPATIIIGQQTGKLASDEDTKTLQKMGMARRSGYLNELISDVIDYCIELDILPRDDYEIVWDDLLEASDGERLDSALKMADINAKLILAPPFTPEEIRLQAGYDEAPQGEEIPPSEDLGDIDED